MIATLSGTISAISQSTVVLDVNGVGYAVSLPKPLVQSISVGQKLLLHTAMIVREDAFTLYGFADVEQLSLFDLLRSVSGVGPKTALAAIGSLTGADIANAVANDDSKVFEQVAGIGAKTAKLIVVTLAGKLKSVVSTGSTLNNDLLLALQGLGWPERIASPVVSAVLSQSPNADLSELIRMSLAALGNAK